MKDQATEIASKSNQAKEVKDKRKTDVDKPNDVKRNKCRYENTGNCRAKNECKDVHPKKTCQSFSKLGSWPLESSCEHRHPYGVCYDWEKFGSCREGDMCRHRHPFDMALSKPSTPDHFLGHGSPNRGMGGQEQGGPGQGGQGQGGQGGQWSQGQVHHDQRGNRW